MEKDKKEKSSRRSFLKKGLIAGAGTVLGGGIVHSFSLTAKGETVKVLGPDNKIKEVSKEHLKDLGNVTTEQLQKLGEEGIAGRRWVMVIDLSKCKNDRNCMKGCQTAHHLWTGKEGEKGGNPNGTKVQHHINVHQMEHYEGGNGYFMPRPCQHCDNPPCTKVCPVGATYKRQDGIVLINNERCIGCRFCVAACPYSARVFNWNDPKDAEKNKDKPYNVELNVPQKRGTITKCLFSADRLREGKMPYCGTSCKNGVFWFGDENEDSVTNCTTGETVRFSELLKDNAAYNLLPELGTKPRVYYLPEKNRTNDFEENKDKHNKKESANTKNA